MNLATIPGYREAVAKERFERTAAFAPLLETICGIKVLPLTFRHLAILETVGSPFVCGGNIGVLDVGTFLWIVSPGFIPAGTWKASRARKRFLEKVGAVRFPAPSPIPPDFNPPLWSLKKCIREIENYLCESEQDFPASSGPAIGKSYCSPVAGIVDALASEYGWDDETILDKPIKRILQYFNRMIARKSGLANGFNPSDAIVQKWLESNQPKRN